MADIIWKEMKKKKMGERQKERGMSRTPDNRQTRVNVCHESCPPSSRVAEAPLHSLIWSLLGGLTRYECDNKPIGIG